MVFAQTQGVIYDASKKYLVFLWWDMLLSETLTQDYKQAFKKRESVKKIILSMVLSQIKNKEIDL
ncbi:MAG: GatB/YqeY domain-containing protein [bacterium]|nr:GatB/YqeY domain-containing protein [bacterium]